MDLKRIPDDQARLSSQRQLVAKIVQSSSQTEAEMLQKWASELIKIERSSLPTMIKAQRALAVTRQNHVILPVLKMMGREIKRSGWDERGTAGRMGLGAAAVGMALFGGQGAGIAAFGTAIGVPLWVVLGSGAAFAGVLVDELKHKNGNSSGATYSVMDAKTSIPIFDERFFSVR